MALKIESFCFFKQNGIPTPDRRVRSRPPSFAGRESPIQLRSRSSTSDSLRSGSSPNSGGNQSSCRNATFFPPTVTTASSSGGSVNTAAALMAGSTSSLSVLTNKKNNNGSTTTISSAAAAVTAANVGSLKKRAAPLPPPTSTFTRASSQNTHSRNASDYGVSYPAQRMKPPSESHSQSRKSLVADYLDSTKTRTFHHSAAHLRMMNDNSHFEIDFN